MVFNVTSAEILDKSGGVTNSAFIKQLSYFCMGIFLGIFLYKMGYRKIIRLAPIFFICAIILLILVFVPKIGIVKNGSRRWVGMYGCSFQPSEIFKYILPIYSIYYFSKEPSYTFKNFIRFLLITIIPVSLILMEPDNGTVLIIFSSLIVFFFLSKVRFVFWGIPFFLCIFLGALLAYNMPYVKNRIFVYLHPEEDLKGKGHQPYQAKIAAGSGGLTGRGLGESLQKLNYLPQARSDYIAAIFAEEFGFLGVVGLICSYLMVTYLGFFIAMKSKDKKGFYLASMMTFLISFQAFLNLGVVSGLLPSKGIVLPFFSQGGTSLLVNIMAVFVILSVHKKKEMLEKEKF